MVVQRDLQDIFVEETAPAGTDLLYAVIDPSGTPVGRKVQMTNLFKALLPIFNVKDFGAIGDAVADDTAAIEATIAVAKLRTGGTLVFPAGAYLISSTINLTSFFGLRFIGAGASIDYNATLASDVSMTHLVWSGAAGGTMFKLDNCQHLSFEYLNLIGKHGAGNQLTNLIHLDTDVGAVGNLVFTKCGFGDATTGIRCGDAAGDNNNSDLSLNHISGRNLTQLLLVNNSNGLNYLANFIACNDTTYIFNFQRGGSLLANMVSNNAEWVLNLGDGGGGVNAGTYIFNGVRLEKNGSTNSSMLLSSSATSSTISAIVAINGLIIADGKPQSGNFDLEIHGGIEVEVSNSRINDLNFANISGLSAMRSALHLRNCKLDLDAFALSDYVTEANTLVHVSYDRIFQNSGFPVAGLRARGIVHQIVTLDNNSTPTVKGASTALTGGTTPITDFDDGVEGQELKILSEHAITITDGADIILNGSTDFVMASGDSLTLIQKADGNWYELSRSVN